MSDTIDAMMANEELPRDDAEDMTESFEEVLTRAGVLDTEDTNEGDHPPKRAKVSVEGEAPEVGAGNVPGTEGPSMGPGEMPGTSNTPPSEAV